MPFILILIFFYSVGSFMDVREFAVSTCSDWWCFFTFNLVHLSFIHLLVNSFVFLSYWRKMKDVINLYFFIPLIIITPALAAMLSSRNTPTLGASAVVYTMIGLYLVAFPLPKDILIKFLFLIIISFVFTFFFSSVNTGIHIYSFLISLVVSLLNRRFIHAKGQ